MARYLETLYATDSTYTKRQLQMAVRLNHDLFTKYLAFLVERGLVQVVTDGVGRETVRVTPRGRDAYHRFVGWVKDLFGDVGQS
ncbi:MAG: winged helix-turn-helix domain-containing protein [Candidatus Thermoplasmatota archaeon]